ncbi:alpha-2-macroglobulin family protein [Flavivirga spongiicola]|uniref:MG2 domain-containing protein n=1 Tax=Flavivirga spongiicola TaxID=421621 RepID=A0ABU7XQJ5_9FLAO|nr:MG2 domain-containing protein [Flavivirga sp. MEBiC05379]MDO5978038.1 MG2 domain-containing protein [Flavivirga sp. MEBiC05379]
MKNALSLLMIILFATFSNAQDNEYKELWAEVEQFEAKGLVQSALKAVENINKLAEKDSNASQLIKSMLFKSKFALVLEEDAQLKIIKDFKDGIEKNTFPTKNILESILANMYWQYFNQNRWKLYNRTKTAEKVDVEDFRTWDLQTLFNEIHVHYQNSLQNGLLLQLEPLSHYDEILNLQKGSRIYRPTLFDILSHNALQFYKTDETHITKPAYKFEIDHPDFLGNTGRFSKLKIASKDTTSLQLNALKIYQDLISFHLKDKKPFALADVNIQRLKFVNQHATFSDKESIILSALKTERDHLKTHEVSTLYDYEIATIYYQQGATYQPKTNEDNRWKLKDAIEICNKAILKFPKSNGAKKCTVLKQLIEQPTLQITAENFLPIQQNARLLIRYKNLNQLQFKIFKLTRNQLSKFNKIYREEEQLAFIKKLNPYKNWDNTLKNEGDYQTHTTEILVPKLNNGTYLIFASPKNDDETFAFSTVQVTNLALIETESTNDKTFQIINRNNGKPIEKAAVKFSYRKNYKDKEITETKTSNQFGEISLPKLDVNYNDLNIEIINNGEKAYFGDYYVSRYYKQQQKKVTYNAFLFTDRSIYRPGQTVYFKAIAFKTKESKPEVLVSEKVYAILYNANGEEVKLLKFKTNEFGSVSGEFILPNNGLNGQYYIEFGTESGHNKSGTTYFSVEEYKRPKFETSFNPVTETFKVNDSVTIKGHALAYAGSHITNAKVVYRVHRKVEYPRWCYWYYPWFNSEPQEITHGEGMTNGKGVFEITFKAIPDQSVDKTNLPIFRYEVTADVTDLNGETRSATTTVNVGYHALTANMYIANFIDKAKKNNALEIDTRNLNGEFIPAKGTVKIYKLNGPKKVLRQRPWSAPDYQEFSQEAFNKLFPHDAYNDEHQASNWKKGDLVFMSSFNTENTKNLNLGKIKKWESGAYIIILESKDKFGQLVKDEIKTTLYSHADKTIADKKLFHITTNKSSYKTGENALITLGSAARNLNVTVQIEKDRKVIKTHIIQLNNNKKTISVPVNNEDIGGFVVNYSFAAYNNFQSGALSISVPYPKMDLSIETTTFRDKLQPGTDETWSFKIKGPQGDKVSAELLASMYDASLDQFKSHTWRSNLINRPIYYSYNQSNAHQSFGTRHFRVYNKQYTRIHYSTQYYDQLNWFGFYFGNNNSIRFKGVNTLSSRVAGAPIMSDEMEVEESVAFMEESDSANLDEVVVMDKETKLNAGDDLDLREEIVEKKSEKPNFDNIKIRKNLQETAFFFPQLKTDSEGNVSFNFTTPEALTQWKLQLLAHTKTLESTTTTLTAVTQKELMVIPNAPRFLREGDHITISTKIANLTEKQLSGQAKLILTDAISGEDVSNKLIRKQANSHPSGELEGASFTVDPKGNTQVSWSLSIPDDVQAVQYKVIAKSEDFSDGEQNALPVLSNRMLVTETLPMWIRSNQTKTFTLDKLKSHTSTTLKNHKLTLEMTSNPAWYAVQALPYLMEYPYACNEQTFSRYYANALASHIANSNPRIQDVFNQWKSQDALISNLEKNEALKSILIQETPWLRDAQSETEQKKRMALLFDLNKMNNELQSAIRKLENNQMNSGAWAWFDGGRENKYITQHIITGFGHLNKLGVTVSAVEGSHNKMISKAIKYLDAQFVKEYKDLRKYNAKVDLNKDHLSYTQLHYLYMRSFYPDVKKSKEVDKITQYYQTQIQKYWLSRPLYAKGLMALVSHRNNDSKTAKKILKSLKETSITSEELGMYWKANTNSWYWYQAPIETQALLIETFSEIGHVIQSEVKHLETIDNLKIWLLKNKQTNRWKTTKATTDAVYALLLQGSDWLSVTEMVDVVLGGQKITPSKLENVKVEAGTGYYKTSWSASEIKPKMAEVKLTKKGKGIAWGSLYWQYFEDLDKITSAETPLKLRKKLFLKQNTDTGETISEITKDTHLKVGDLVRVRIELRSDRNMEFIHMKDMRASGLEPVNVFSQYKWQDGLGYYESTKDASTNFFFDYLPKGVYVFEYDLRVNNAGNMSNGITTIQSMYAPEFSSHSEGTRLLVK